MDIKRVFGIITFIFILGLFVGSVYSSEIDENIYFFVSDELISPQDRISEEDIF